MDAPPEHRRDPSFGDLLRRHREAAGLTQVELAELAELSVRGLRYLEQGVHHPYRDTIRRLASALVLSPDERRALQEAAQRDTWQLPPEGARRRTRTVTLLYPDGPHPTSPSVARRQHNLPAQVTRFIGREQQLGEVRHLLEERRLVTLTGAGGCGKTRLALEVAAHLAERYIDGVWFVDLAPLGDPGLVLPAIAHVVGVRAASACTLAATLADALRDRHLLLLLDNCEHLIAACATAAGTLLYECPRLQVLATSREPLRITGETSWRVPSMVLPDPQTASSPERLAQSEAVRLFLDRATAVAPHLALTWANAAAVARICQRLDGMPLALELAAARVRALTVEEIAIRLDQRFLLLTEGSRMAVPRQQTLQATVEWSYSLLTPREQTYFKRLSIFSGGWSLQAAEAVCAEETIAPEDVLELLARLVDKSLVTAEPMEDGSTRYRLLETLRQYGQECLLRDSGETERLGEQHATFFLNLVEATPYQELVAGPQQGRRLAGLEREHDNLRTALRWLITHEEIERAFRLAGGLGRFWYYQGHLSEGRAWLAELLARTDAPVTAAARAMAVYTAGNLAAWQGDLATAAPLLRESLALWHDLQRPIDAAYSLLVLGMVAQRSGDAVHAQEWLEQARATCVRAPNLAVEGVSNYYLAELACDAADHTGALALATKALEIASQIEHRAGKAMALGLLGEVRLEQGDHGAATHLLHTGVTEARRVGSVWTAWALARLVSALAVRGDRERAWTAAAESLEVSRRLGDRLGIARALESFALLAGRQGNQERGLRLAAAALSLRRVMSAPRAPREERALQRALAAAGTPARAEAAEASIAEGGALSLEQAIAEALDSGGHAQGGGAAAGLKDLTRRECEVLRHLERGWSNRQIAQELVLGERTVESHVGNILGKLGLRSRAQAAIWAVEQRISTAPP